MLGLDRLFARGRSCCHTPKGIEVRLVRDDSCRIGGQVLGAAAAIILIFGLCMLSIEVYVEERRRGHPLPPLIYLIVANYETGIWT